MESCTPTEKATPRRGRPRKAILPATPTSPGNIEENSALEVSVLNHGTAENLPSETEKVTPRRGRPKKVMLPTTPSSPACIENVSGKDSLIKKPDENIDAENSSPLIEKATPRRGRPKKSTLPPTPCSPLYLEKAEQGTPREAQPVRCRRTPKLQALQESTQGETDSIETPGKRGRKRKMSPSPEKETNTKLVSIKVKPLSNVVCGVCKKEMPEPNFTYHRYSVHYGLARPEGASQVFSETEKAQELKKTLEKIKKLCCTKCPASFTTLLGFQYHQKRCGVDVSDLQNMMSECTICGKRVMALTAHMKVHEKRPERLEKQLSESIAQGQSPATKSKRAAAQKAVSLLREIKEDLADGSAQKPMNKALKLFTDPSNAVKVTNSIIVAWKKQIEKNSIAQCRYPGCSFTGNDIEELKRHHVDCKIGSNTKSFACLKCEFRSQERTEILEHVLSTHITEKDSAFEGNSESSDETDEDGEDEFESLEGDALDRRKSIPQNTKNVDKAYGLTYNFLQQFKSLSTPQLIPTWLAQFHKKNFTWDTELYGHWEPKFQELQNPTCYFPTVTESIPFARQQVAVTNIFPKEPNVSFETLQRFQSKLQNGTPVFFCGGSIQSAAWCPMPPCIDGNACDERDQYLALSVFHEEHKHRPASEGSFESSYLIQFWNCGNLLNAKPATSVPKLEFCIAHSYGRVWSLVWCPSGCYSNERLGLLAASCSDGTTRIFSVPHGSKTVSGTEDPFFFSTEVKVTLRLNTKESSECTSLDWDSTSGHRFLTAGFANGIVAIWDLQTKSPILSKDDTFYPIWSFYAHSSVVSAVSLSPHHNDARFIATASTDRIVKLWDRLDPSVPISWSRRARVTDIKWRQHWPGILVCVEDVCALFRTSSMFYDFGYTGNKQALLPQNSVVWCSAENPYLDMIAHSTDAGEIVIYSSHLAVFDCDEKKLRKQRKLVLRTDLVDFSKKDCSLNRMKKVYMESSKKAGGTKLEQRVKANYSLIFNDVTSKATQHIMGRKQPPVNYISCENMDILQPCDDPITSVNKISFNPNLQSHTWMCVCGESGLVQLLCIDSTSVSKATECYIKEMKKRNDE